MDLFGIGNTMNALSNVITGSLNYKEQKKAREENMAFQKVQFNYLKEQNALQQHREDTAVGRKMQDLRNNGLNPLAADATGGASTGATGSTTSFSGEQAAQRPLDMLSGLQIEADSLYNLMGAKNGLAQQQAQTDNLQQDLINKQQEVLESQGRITNTTEDTNLKKKQQEQIGKQMEEIDQKMTNMKTENDINTWNLNKSKWGNIRTTDTPSKYSVGLGKFNLSFDENSGLIRNNPALNAIGRVAGEITNGINAGIDGLKNWGRKKYNQMRGKAK